MASSLCALAAFALLVWRAEPLVREWLRQRSAAEWQRHQRLLARLAPAAPSVASVVPPARADRPDIPADILADALLESEEWARGDAVEALVDLWETTGRDWTAVRQTMAAQRTA